MKSLYCSHYSFYRSDLAPQKILAISDIHFAGELTKNHRRVSDFAKQSKPNLIVVPGDIIDNIGALASDASKKEFKNWFAELGKIAPVCICLGNHDPYYEIDNPVRIGRRKYIYDTVEESPLIECLAGVKNVHVLDNGVFENEQNYAFGLSMPPEYYDTPAHPYTEDKKILINELRKNAARLKNLPKNKAKIFLMHSPTYLADSDVCKYLDEFDFVFAGHMHNGVVPPILQEIWRGHRGFVTATKKIFANQNTRLGLYGGKPVVLGAVTTVTPKAKEYGLIDAIFPANVALVEISHKKSDGTKPSVKRRYKKW